MSSRASPAGRRGLWLRSEPPRAVGFVCGVPSANGGSAQGFAGVNGGTPWTPPNWPQSAALKLAPSPPETYSFSSAPKSSAPVE